MTLTLNLRLVGAISLHDGNGNDCTPRGAKARGIIALLALTPDRRRSRRWIEAKLWSDRGPEQASGSLRQALMELRAALGAAADNLVTDREFVALNALTTDMETDPEGTRAALAAGHELFEGIDVRDQAFEAWLRDQRVNIAGQVSPHLAASVNTPAGIPLLIKTGEIPSGYGGFVALALADAIGGLVSEFASIDVFAPAGATVQIGPQERGLILSIEAAEANGQLHLMVSLGASRTGQALWSRRAALSLREKEMLTAGEFPGIVFEAAEAALTALPKLVGAETTLLKVEGMVARAVREMFSFDVQRLRVADSLLCEATRLQPSPRIYAWYALLRQIMTIERTESDRSKLSGEAEIFARKAMEGAPSNPLVLSLISQVQVMLTGNTEAGVALARDAIALSPNNAFGYAAQAGSLLRSDRPDEALVAAQHGAGLAKRSGLLQWWEALAGLAHVSLGDYQSAIALFEAAHARAPHFRSPMRHLLFLYLKCGEPEKALFMLNELTRAEPDFSFDLIRDDPEYPAGTLRRVELLKLKLPGS